MCFVSTARWNPFVLDCFVSRNIRMYETVAVIATTGLSNADVYLRTGSYCGVSIAIQTKKRVSRRVLNIEARHSCVDGSQ